MDIRKEYEAFEKQHQYYEGRMFKIVFREFRRLIRQVPLQGLTPGTVEPTVLLNIKPKQLEEALFKAHYSIGRDYGLKVAKRLRKEPNQKKWKPQPLFSQTYRAFLLDYYNQYGGENITLLTGTLVDAIKDELINAVDENLSVEQIQKRFRERVKSNQFYRWQALRIARTETTFALNSAKQIAGDTSGVAFEKVWIGKTDGRERESHRNAIGDRVDQNGKFNIGGFLMRFPGDRESGAPASELVNCRCTMGYVPKRDENGRLIFRD